MTKFEAVQQSDVDPAYRERLLQILENPIFLDPSDIDNRVAPPTPLDSDNVYVRSYDKPISSWYEPEAIPYRDYAVKSGVMKATTHVESMGRGGVMSEYHEAETIIQLKNRMNHNSEAFIRLAVALTERPADDVMLEIVLKARSGTASLPEMVRLIKEYPEMVSIEVSSFYATAGGPEGYDPIRAAYEAAGSLVKNFRDAEVKLGDPGTAPRVKESTLIPGVNTRKRVIATIASVDSLTEMVLKESYLEVGGREWLLGVSTYLRTGDRQIRPGYAPEDYTPEWVNEIDSLPPEIARQLLGQMAASQALDPDA